MIPTLSRNSQSPRGTLAELQTAVATAQLTAAQLTAMVPTSTTAPRLRMANTESGVLPFFVASDRHLLEFHSHQLRQLFFEGCGTSSLGDEDSKSPPTLIDQSSESMLRCCDAVYANLERRQRETRFVHYSKELSAHHTANDTSHYRPCHDRHGSRA